MKGVCPVCYRRSEAAATSPHDKVVFRSVSISIVGRQRAKRLQNLVLDEQTKPSGGRRVLYTAADNAAPIERAAKGLPTVRSSSFKVQTCPMFASVASLERGQTKPIIGSI